MANERAGADATSFGDLLRRLRKRLGMTQDDLAAATGYSRSLIASLEGNRRLPDLDAITHRYIPALCLQDEPRLAAQLVELAAAARGEQPPMAFGLKLQAQLDARTQNVRESGSLRAPPAEIIGRSRDIDFVCAQLLGRRARLLTLLGPPGVGKTRLSQAVSRACREFYRDGVFFVSLAQVSNPELVAPSILSALQAPGSPGRPPRSRLVEYLRRKEMLLVLDNFEQLLAVPGVRTSASEAVDLVADLLAECPDIAVLITSRERLHLRAEQRYRVQPLPLEAAVDLFVRRCSAVDAGFAVTASDRIIIEAICRQADCLPLALELAAGHCDLLSLPQLLTGLQSHRLDLLVDGAVDLPPQQRTLRAAIARSYELLDDSERAVLRGMSVFAGGCNLDAVARVAFEGRANHQEGETRPMLACLHILIGKSLIRSEAASDGTMRYLVLETIRDFALEQAREAGEEDLLRRRHYDTYLELFRTADPHLRGPDAVTWLARLEPEQDNVRAALQWALDQRGYADMAWLLLSVAWFWHHTGRWHEKFRWLVQLLPHRGVLDPCLRLAVLEELETAARTSDEFRRNQLYAAEMLELLEECPSQPLHARLWHLLANVSAGLSEAAATWERAISCARAAATGPALGPEFGAASDTDYLLGGFLHWYASRLIEHGDFGSAMPLLEESASLFQARGSNHLVALASGTKGRLALLQGELAEARGLLRDAVVLARAANYQDIVGRLQPFLGIVTLYTGDLAEARALLADSLRLCLDLNDAFFLARVCTYLAETALWEGKLAEAQQWLAQSVGYHADARWSGVFVVERLLVAGRLATAQADYPRAAALFGAADAVRSEIGYQPMGPVRQLSDAALAIVGEALGPSLFAIRIAAGRQLSLAEAFAVVAGALPFDLAAEPG